MPAAKRERMLLYTRARCYIIYTNCVVYIKSAIHAHLLNHLTLLLLVSEQNNNKEIPL